MKKDDNSALSPQTREQLRKVKTADLLVGISSYNNAHTINYVVYQAAQGLDTYFPNMESAIFVSDGNSTDGTLAVVKAMRFPFQVSVIPAIYQGVSGKGSAVKAVFEAAKFLDAKAVALTDSDLRSITPDWIKLLISPTLVNTGLVTPFYVRHKYDGTITNFLCYPVTSALYGKKIRQPIGGDFGLSRELVEELLESPLWQTPYVPRFGIDIFETHTALAKKFNVKQAFLGTKVHDAKDPSKHLAPMFRQVMGSMFTCIARHQKTWKKISGFSEAEIVGEEKYTGAPEPIVVDLQNLTKTYKEGFDQNKQIYETILEKQLLEEVEKLRNNSELSFSPEIWAKTVYSFVAGFKNREILEKERLLDALRTLWIGKVAAFVNETLELDTAETEKLLDKEVEAFRRLKPFLLDLF
ncbi:MAG: glycosyltransferase [Candidatus Bathyarchaeia archaeon]